MLDTQKYISDRLFTSRHIKSVTRKLTTKLVDPKKTKSQSTGPIYETAFAFLSSIEQILDDVALIASKRGVSVGEQPASTMDNKIEKRDELSSAEIVRLDDEEAKFMFQMLDDDR